jgi:DNA-binding LacI/PurR family transcriptional regulator
MPSSALHTGSNRATIKEVAEAAGVSVATVSRVLSGARPASPEMAQRVREAAARLEYSPNRLAASLRRAHSLAVGLITSDSTNAYSAEVARSAQQALAAAGYVMILCDAARDPEREREYLDILLQTRTAGCIVMSAAREAAPFEKFSRRHKLPIVLVDSLKSAVLDSVRVDSYAGVLHGVAHLVSRGYQRIAIIAGRQTSLAGFERLDAFRGAVNTYHLECPESYIRAGEFTETTGYQAALDLMRLDPRPQAIFASNNTIGAGAFRALKTLKIGIPAEVALLIFDDIPLADLCDPPLTVIAQPTVEIGKTAAQLLLSRLGGEPTTETREIVHQPRLILRGST